MYANSRCAAPYCSAGAKSREYGREWLLLTECESTQALGAQHLTAPREQQNMLVLGGNGCSAAQCARTEPNTVRVGAQYPSAPQEPSLVRVGAQYPSAPQEPSIACVGAQYPTVCGSALGAEGGVHPQGATETPTNPCTVHMRVRVGSEGSTLPLSQARSADMCPRDTRDMEHVGGLSPTSSARSEAQVRSAQVLGTTTRPQAARALDVEPGKVAHEGTYMRTSSALPDAHVQSPITLVMALGASGGPQVRQPHTSTAGVSVAQSDTTPLSSAQKEEVERLIKGAQYPVGAGTSGAQHPNDVLGTSGSKEGSQVPVLRTNAQAAQLPAGSTGATPLYGLPRPPEIFTEKSTTPVDIWFASLEFYMDEVGVQLQHRVRVALRSFDHRACTKLERPI